MEDALIISKFADERTREEAFGDLLKKYQQKIYWHVRRMVIDHDDADDVVQDIFIKVWRKREKLREDFQLDAWLDRIATSECVPFLNREKQKRGLSLDDDSSAYLAGTLADGSYFNGDQAQMKLQ